MFVVLILISVLFSTPVGAATMSDLQTAVLAEDHARVNTLAQEFLAGAPSKEDKHEAQYYLGLSYVRLEKYGEAYTVFKKLLSAHPSDNIYDKAAVGLLDSLTFQEKYTQVLKEAGHFMSRRKSSEMLGTFYLKAARAHMKLADWSKAWDLLRKIVSEYPGSFESEAAQLLLEEKQFFTVQVGSFSDRQRAQGLVKELTRRQEYAYIVEAKGHGKTYYRVRVGQMSTLKDAKELEAKLSRLGYPTLIYP